MDNKGNKRNLSYEIIIVVIGTFLTVISFISINLSPELLLSEEENRLVQGACNARDTYGNYSDDSIECISNICYLNSNDETYGIDCDKFSVVSLTSNDYDQAKERFDEVKSLCDSIDETGLYLDQDDNYCIDGLCTTIYNEKEYHFLCPSVITKNDESAMLEENKIILNSLCDNYKKGEVIKEGNDSYECKYNTCKVIDEENKIAYALRCDINVYKVLDEWQNKDDIIINENLSKACINDSINEERFRENIRCSHGLCSFHYKQDNYYMRCSK